MILKFGKYKGLDFENTPKSYQQWLLSQSWFKMPVQNNQPLTAMENAQKNISTLSSNLSGWNGHSRNGSAIYDRIFENEKAIEDLLYCDCGNRKDPEEKHCGCGGIYGL